MDMSTYTWRPKCFCFLRMTLHRHGLVAARVRVALGVGGGARPSAVGGGGDGGGPRRWSAALSGGGQPSALGGRRRTRWGTAEARVPRRRRRRWGRGGVGRWWEREAGRWGRAGCAGDDARRRRRRRLHSAVQEIGLWAVGERWR